MGLALPGPGLAPLVLAVPGLLRRAVAGTSGCATAGSGWLAGFSQWVVAVPWVYIVLHRYGHMPAPLAVVAVALMAAILACTWALAVYLAGRAPEGWRPWLLPTALAAAEAAQGLPPWQFPWNPVAAVLTPWPALLAPAPVLGALGLSWAVLLVGGGLDGLVERGLRRSGVTALAIGAAAFVLGAVAAPPFRTAGAPVRVGALQPDVPLEYRWDAENLAAIEAKVWLLTQEAAAAGAEWVVFPESAVPRLVERDGAWRLALERFARRSGAWLLVGSIGLGDGESYYNSVFSIAPGGVTPYRFDKVHLVPFGEYVPLLGRLAFARALVREVGAFTPGRSRMPLPSPAGPAGVAVCYEVAFPELAAAEVRRGARVLVTITNDGWYGDSAAPRQHLALAVLRAAETRRWLVRSANTGISAIIDPSGRPVERLEFSRSGVIVAAVTPGEGLTPAVAAGGWLHAGPVTTLLGAILLAARRRPSPTSAPPVR